MYFHVVLHLISAVKCNHFPSTVLKQKKDLNEGIASIVSYSSLNYFLFNHSAVISQTLNHQAYESSTLKSLPKHDKSVDVTENTHSRIHGILNVLK